MRTVFPEIEVATPNSSPTDASGATSLCSSLHTVPDRAKTYADPPRSIAGEPITAVSATSDTDAPKRSPGAASEATSSCCSFHVVPDLTNAYADPDEVPAAGAPTIAVSPDSAT